MGRLKHRISPAATYFVTTKTWENRALFQVPEISETLVRRILSCRDKGPYLLHEFVVMPDHLHLILTPAEATALEKAIQLIKGGSSYEIHRLRRNKMEIWQPGFHDWTIRDSADYAAKRAYIQQNPVRVGLVDRAEEWAFCSASGKFVLDAEPERFCTASGAEAPEI